METQVAYTNPMKPKLSRRREVAKTNTPIPEGYVSAEALNDDGVTEMQDDLTPEERAYWEASVERDMRNHAEGRMPNYLSGDEFWGKVEESVNRRYERVQA